MDCYEEEGGDEMRKRLLCLLGILFAVSVLAGCQQKDPEPGEVAGYDAVSYTHLTLPTTPYV